VAVGILVPNRDSTIVFMVRTKLVEDEVGVNSRLDVVGTIRSMGESPLEIGLVSMGVLVPTCDWGIIVSNSSLQMSNWAKLTLEVESLSTSCKVVWAAPVLLVLDRNKSPLQVCLIDVVPLGDWGSIGSSGTINMNTFAVVDESDGPPFTSLVVELDL